MEAFPCPLERTAATALLLLSSSPPSLSSNSSSSCFEEFFCNDSSNSSSKDDSSSSISKSSSSTLTNERSSEEILAHRLRVLASAARFHEIKCNVVRSRRSKNYRNSDRRKIPSFEWSKSETFTPASVSEVTEPSSLSSASSTTSCRMVRVEKKWPGITDENMTRIKIRPASLRRRAETILKLLSLGCACEGRIRGKLGDTPDTSKALRMLLRLEEVKRSGAGGRFDPFTYTVARPRCN